MKRSTTERLAKILPLLASDKDGEVLAAVGKIRGALEAEGADFHDLVRRIGVGRVDQPEFVIRPRYRPSRPGRPFNFADTFRQTKTIGAEDLSPDASAVAFGLPLYHPDQIDSWQAVARYCLDEHRKLPRGKKHRFEINPTPLCASLRHALTSRRYLTEGELSVFWHTRERHRCEPLIISTASTVRGSLGASCVTPSGYRAELYVGSESEPESIVVTAPSRRRAAQIAAQMKGAAQSGSLLPRAGSHDL